MNLIDPHGLYPGQMPPAPPGYDPGTWSPNTWDDNTPYLRAPDRRIYTPHPEDEGHWRHWDIQDPDGSDGGRWPDNSKKPWPNQRKPNCDQSSNDPSGDAPEFQWPTSMIPFVPLPTNIPLRIPQISPLPFRIPIPVW